uniref:Uncharacterized protein n=1 Tax=Acrobeloides nanus TaxID=290746 RepID=A0A914CW60_9BILA
MLCPQDGGKSTEDRVFGTVPQVMERSFAPFAKSHIVLYLKMKELKPAIIRMYQNEFREISRLLDVPKSPMIDVIKRFEKTVLTHVYGVAKAIRERMGNFIRVPSSPEEWLSMAKDFERRTCLPNSLGESRFEETGANEDRAGRSRKRAARTTKNCQRIRGMFKRNPRNSSRKLAKKLGISDRTVRRILYEELGMKPFKFKKR